jgi:hypothetical protein
MATQNYEVTVNPNAITLDLTTQNNILTVETVDYVLSLSRTGGQGAQGYSAYEIAVQNGYTGTAQQFAQELSDLNAKSAAAVASAAAAATSASSASVSASTASTNASVATASANAAAQSAVTAASQANASSQSATNSAASALQSSNYADAAEDSAIDAQLSASDASASEDAAASSEANTLLYRNEAQTAAITATTGSNNANAQALAASLSATSAATSATNADNSEDNASVSAMSALNSATSANTSANQAAISATAATTQATNAATSATNAAASQADALVSKNSAIASASTATTKASEASTSANTAATKATEASTSASQAALSATAASASASTATAKAAEAAQSAADAAAAQAAAEASLASFRSTYLGELNADPTLDGNGNPVMIGAEYFNTVANKLKVYTSTGWQFYDATAQTASQNAALSASQAASSAATSQSYATTAINKAAEAATSATAADASADAALASENAAESSEINASASENYAFNYKNAAATSADLASSKASEAALSATSASTSAATATTQATNSANSATASATSATNSANSALASANSATNSANSATSSANSAATATSAAANVAVLETNAFNSAATATTKAAEAASSASAASLSAASASTSETNAATSANTAITNAATATTKASEALTSANNAATSATSAGTSASNAATSATSASSSATSASNSATSASGSAASADTNATLAGNSANAAAISETNAATSASSASIYATNASNSATSADTSESNAEVYADNALASANAAATSETNAIAAESAAAASAANALTSSLDSSSSALTATTKASEASASATTASTQATNAASSATSAASSATTATTKASEAASSATNAATAATNAATSATNADNSSIASAASAISASNSASIAATKATEASTSETNAATSATTASSAATTATTQATNASNSASAASTSASNAANSASTATSQAGIASSAASAASASASAAGISENNANTAATNAASSASAAGVAKAAAEAARDQALAAFDNFDDKYLGEKASNPGLDNDGNALVAGALYFNTTDSSMKVYSGSVWLNAYASLAGALLVANNLSDLSNAATARTNLGLGTAATTNSTAYATAAQGALIDNIVSATKEPIGFVNKNDSSISFNSSTRVFTISPVGASFEVWCKGVKNVVSTAQTITLPNTTALYYIYYSNLGVLSYKTTYFTWDSDTPVSYVYWNATTSQATYFADERHGTTLDWATHEYLHRTRGAVIASGFAANGYTLSGTGDLNSHAQISIESGTFFDEDIEINVVSTATPTQNTWTQNLLFPAKIPVLRLSGASEWILDTATDYPLKQGTARPQYNYYSGGVWLTADVLNNDYTCSWIIATNNLNHPVMAIISQSNLTTLSNAQSAKFEELTLTNFPSLEFRPLYKLIFQGSDGYANTPNARLREIYDLRAVQAAGVSAATVNDHSNLSGLSDDDHPQYLHVDNVRNISAAVKASFLPSQTGNDNKFLKTSGTDTSWSLVDVGNVSGTLSITHGGTGATTTANALTNLGAYPASNPNGYIAGITSSMVTSALGYTPYNATNPSNYITTAGARAAISVTGAGSYDSATGVINIVGGVTSFNTRTGAITLNSSDVTTALGFTPYNATNPSGYISGITSGMVTTALGYTPYDSSNPSGYITSSALSPYLTSATAASTYLTSATAASTYFPLSGNATLTGQYLDFSQSTVSLRITSGPGRFNIGDDDSVVLASAFRFYTGGADGNASYGDFRTNPATGNSIISAKTGGLYFNYDHGTGGVLFCNGAATIVGTVDASGNANFAGAITQNTNQVLHAGNYSSYALPLSGGTLNGTIQHNGLVMSSGTNVDQLYTVADTLTLTTSWQDTSINAAELSTGSYVVQVYADDHGVNGTQYSTYYTGMMSWFATNTNETSSDEIVLHRAGHASNSGVLFLRVLRTSGPDTADLKLQIAGNTNNSGTSTYTFKFRRLI